MKSNSINELLSVAVIRLRRASPVILTSVSMVGVIATVTLAVNATPKAVEKIRNDSVNNHNGNPDAYTKIEAIKSAWRYYVPCAITGVSTLICIAGANILNKQQQATLTSAYALLDNSYQQYKGKLKELYGEEAHQNIIDSIAKDTCRDVYISGQDIMGTNSLDFDEHNPDDNKLFYDTYSKRYFESSINRVIQAEYFLNRDYTLAACASLNQFYNYLGLESIPEGDELGWSCGSGIYWLDFNHHKTILDDGLEVHVIDIVWTPELGYDE
jgi:hypothetical protein